MPVAPDALSSAVVITRAARFVVLQYLMNGASGERTYVAKTRRKTLASRPRPVAGMNPGSTALTRNRGISRANANAEARVHSFDVAWPSAPGILDPPGFHSPRALASTERYRAPRKPAILAG